MTHIKPLKGRQIDVFMDALPKASFNAFCTRHDIQPEDVDPEQLTRATNALTELARSIAHYQLIRAELIIIDSPLPALSPTLAWVDLNEAANQIPEHRNKLQRAFSEAYKIALKASPQVDAQKNFSCTER